MVGFLFRKLSVRKNEHKLMWVKVLLFLWFFKYFMLLDNLKKIKKIIILIYFLIKNTLENNIT